MNPLPKKPKTPTLKDIRVVKLLSLGYTISEASEKTGQSKRKVEQHMDHLKIQFGCTNTVALACEFLRQGIIE